MNAVTNDRTDHNRLSEQFAARLREQMETTSVKPQAQAEAVVETKPEAAPKRTRRAAAAVVEIATPAEPQAPVERIAKRDFKIIDCAQNSPEWHSARLGIPTASAFADILAEPTGKVRKMRRTYMLKLAGEILTGQPTEMITNAHMERGHLMEPEARDFYVLQTGAELQRVGFIRSGNVGCSPDSLIGNDGGVEIKTKLPHLQLDVLLKDEFPDEHKAQVQGALWLTDREWWDIVTYWPGLPTFIKRAYRDEAYIKALADEVDRFNDDLAAIVARMRRCMDVEDTGFAAAA